MRAAHVTLNAIVGPNLDEDQNDERWLFRST